MVRRFASEYRINYPIVMLTPELRKHFPNVYALPTTFVIDRETRIVQKHLGMLKPAYTELEARALAGFEVNASIERVDADQPVNLENAAQVTSVPRGRPGSFIARAATRSNAETQRGRLHLRM